VGVAADDQRGRDPGRRALDEHGELGEVFGVVAQLDPLADQARVDLVVVAGQGDGRGLGDLTGRRPAERLGQQHRVGGPRRPAGQEPGDRWLAGLGMDASVGDLLRPGGEPVVQLVEAGDAGGLGLDQEPLPDEPHGLNAKLVLHVTLVCDATGSRIYLQVEHRRRARRPLARDAKC